MINERIAVIDIGSNSIRYMEAELNERGFGFSDKLVYTTRLAQGLITSGILSQDRIDASIDVLKELSERAARSDLSCRCYATSAVRDAHNREAFLTRVLSETGLSISILSGDEEALYARIGAGQTSGGLIDIGGGSSQVITADYKKSFPMGCVRVKDLCGGQSLEAMRDILLPHFEAMYLLPAFSKLSWTAVGGSATTLAALSLGLTAYDPKRIADACLTQESLLSLLYQLDKLGTEGRSAHPLLIKRHDVIRGGGLILLYLMQTIGIESIRFSDADGLDGYAMHLLQNGFLNL